MKLNACLNWSTNDILCYPYKRILLSHTTLQFLQINSFNEIIRKIFNTLRKTIFWRLPAKHPGSPVTREFNHLQNMFKIHLLNLRACEIPRSVSKTVNNFFHYGLHWRLKKKATHTAGTMSVLCVAIFWVVNASSGEQSCSQFSIPTGSEVGGEEGVSH